MRPKQPTITLSLLNVYPHPPTGRGICGGALNTALPVTSSYVSNG